MDEEVPMVQRVLGSALVTGAALASIGITVGRPMVREGIRSACQSSSSVRSSSLRAARDVRQAAWESAGPMVKSALTAKDRARRRAVGMLTPEMADVVEAWRQDFIGAEKTVYYGGKAFLKDLEPRSDGLQDRGFELMEQLLDIFGEVVDASVAAAATVGADLQKPAPAAKRPAARKRARR